MPNVIPLPVRASDEADLIARVRGGDSASITQLYRQHHAKVRAFATRMLGDRTAAEDVVHDAFVALPDALARFRMDAKLETFLMSIGVNLCRRRLRSQARARRAFERAHERDPREPVTTPEAHAQQRRLADALRRGLETLSVDHREVFVLCAIEERSSIEVAEIVGVPEGTVRSRLFHARKQLRAFLEAEGIE